MSEHVSTSVARGSGVELIAAEEKEARIRYQDVVYAACAALDAALGRSITLGHGTLATLDGAGSF